MRRRPHLTRWALLIYRSSRLSCAAKAAIRSFSSRRSRSIATRRVFAANNCFLIAAIREAQRPTMHFVRITAEVFRAHDGTGAHPTGFPVARTLTTPRSSTWAGGEDKQWSSQSFTNPGGASTRLDPSSRGTLDRRGAASRRPLRASRRISREVELPAIGDTSTARL